jgi:MOSC domain-containing protein YiiM/nuclear transport factor 2 (NTF2) superfamily protein
MRDQIWEVIK